MMSAVRAYVAIRRALGYRFVEPERVLRHFARFAESRHERFVRSQSALDWASRGANPEQRCTRLQTVARFARYSHAEDSRHQVPPDNAFPYRKVRPRPHIYSDEEIIRLLEESARLGPAGSLRPLTYNTLFGLLAVTGLRLSEALRLRFEDVGVDGLMIRETKFHKSRLVPLHCSGEAALKRYLSVRREFPTNDPHLFISLAGHPLRKDTVGPVFRSLRPKIGLLKGRGAHAPRIHDLRHSFCVKALLRCPSGPDRVDRHMLAVSTYLGHTDVASTFWYLQATPELMVGISHSSERLFRGNRT